MIEVGIRELKANLSKYIKTVINGETVIITDHDHIVAQIKRPDDILKTSKTGFYLEEEIAKGNIQQSPIKETNIDKYLEKLKFTQSIPWASTYQDSREDR